MSRGNEAEFGSRKRKEKIEAHYKDGKKKESSKISIEGFPPGRGFCVLISR